jgi:DNA-binding phage protein
MPEGTFTGKERAEDLNDGREIYIVDITASFAEYCANARFRRLLDKGRYVFVAPGYLVVDDPRYVTFAEDGPALTEYAKEHLSECCLRLEPPSKGTATEELGQTSVPPAGKKALQVREPAFRPGGHDTKALSHFEELHRFYDELMEDSWFSETAELSFAQMVAAIIRHRGYNRQVFAEKTQLSTKTYDRIMRDDMPSPSLQTVMAICIGLQLGLEHSERLLKLAGHRLTASPLHRAYRKLLATHIGHTLKSCNDVLVALGLPPIVTRPRRRPRKNTT